MHNSYVCCYSCAMAVGLSKRPWLQELPRPTESAKILPRKMEDRRRPNECPASRTTHPSRISQCISADQVAVVQEVRREGHPRRRSAKCLNDSHVELDEAAFVRKQTATMQIPQTGFREERRPGRGEIN